jgi:hypothetical protein
MKGKRWDKIPSIFYPPSFTETDARGINLRYSRETTLLGRRRIAECEETSRV